jgi:hypothetical protein
VPPAVHARAALRARDRPISLSPPGDAPGRRVRALDVSTRSVLILRGRRAALDLCCYWSSFRASQDEFEASVSECRDLGDTVIAFGRLRGQFKSGVALEVEIAWVARYRDGLLVWGRVYRTRAEAFEAVGLRE